jgi:hypothetical protein
MAVGCRTHYSLGLNFDTGSPEILKAVCSTFMALNADGGAETKNDGLRRRRQTHLETGRLVPSLLRRRRRRTPGVCSVHWPEARVAPATTRSQVVALRRSAVQASHGRRSWSEGSHASRGRSPSPRQMTSWPDFMFSPHRYEILLRLLFHTGDVLHSLRLEPGHCRT